MIILIAIARLVAAAAALAIADCAVRPEFLPTLAAIGGTAAAMGVWAAALMCAAAAPLALGPARGLAAVLGAGMVLRGAAIAAPWMTGPAAPMADAAALVAPLALAAAGALLLRWAIVPRRGPGLTPKGAAPRSRA